MDGDKVMDTSTCTVIGCGGTVTGYCTPGGEFFSICGTCRTSWDEYDTWPGRHTYETGAGLRYVAPSVATESEVA